MFKLFISNNALMIFFLKEAVTRCIQEAGERMNSRDLPNGSGEAIINNISSTMTDQSACESKFHQMLNDYKQDINPGCDDFNEYHCNLTEAVTRCIQEAGKRMNSRGLTVKMESSEQTVPTRILSFCKNKHSVKKKTEQKLTDYVKLMSIFI